MNTINQAAIDAALTVAEKALDKADALLVPAAQAAPSMAAEALDMAGTVVMAVPNALESIGAALNSPRARDIITGMGIAGVALAVAAVTVTATAPLVGSMVSDAYSSVTSWFSRTPGAESAEPTNA